MKYIPLIFLVGLAIWFIWYMIHTKADRDWNNTVVKNVRDNMPRNGYASQDQREAAQGPYSVESDEYDPNSKVVLMPNQTKKNTR